MLDEEILIIQKINDKLFVLLFLYKRYINIHLPITDNEVAVYGKNSNWLDMLLTLLIYILINNVISFIIY